MTQKKNKIFSGAYVALLMLFLYLPILVLIVFSFNSSKGYSWTGFSFKWYVDLFSNELILNSLKNTLIVAFISSIFATVIGASAAIGVFSMQNKFAKNTIKSVTNLPLLMPEIVTGISMMLLFITVGSLINANILGFGTILIAHITFSLPYVILSVMPKLKQLDPNLSEAALDLGCTPLQAFWKVELPAILPGIFSGMIMAFTLSLDDFVISYFTTGASFKTFPTYIYSLVKKPFKPNIYALSSIMTVAILILLIISNIVSSKDSSAKPQKAKPAKGGKA